MLNPSRVPKNKDKKIPLNMSQENAVISPITNQLVYKKLLEMVKSCPNRIFTGTFTAAPCCKSEGGKVFRCTLYNVKPAKVYDCLICRRDYAIKEELPWLLPLLRLSQGSDSQLSSLRDLLRDLSDR